jgi:hypothetical protein
MSVSDNKKPPLLAAFQLNGTEERFLFLFILLQIDFAGKGTSLLENILSSIVFLNS